MKHPTQGRARRVRLALTALSIVALHAPALAYTDLYGQLLQEVDYPNGTLFGYGISKRRPIELWQAAPPQPAASLGTVDLGRDHSRTIERQISATEAVPEKVLKALKNNPTGAKPEGPSAWLIYWVRERVTPAAGASPARMFSSAQRRFVQCEAGRVFDAGTLHFASLENQGEPYAADINYERPRVWDAKLRVLPAPLVAEFRAICAPVFTAALGEQAGRERLEQVLAPPPPQPPVGSGLVSAALMKRLIELQAAAAAQAAASQAAAAQATASQTAASSASALAADKTASPQSTDTTETAETAGTSAPLPPGAPGAMGSTFEPGIARKKARIRLYQFNGLNGGLTKAAACVAPESRKAGGAGTIFKAIGSMGRRPASTTIGMPTSSHAEEMRGFNGYHVEREVDADMPVAVDYGYGAPGGEGGSCPQIGVSFVPEAGVDYEAWLDVNRGLKMCFVRVARILPGGALLPEPISGAPECPPSPR